MAPAPRGFTLIEIMVTVVIIAILAAIALPSYTDYVTRGRVVEATANLSDARAKMEQYFQDNRSYPTACTTATPGATEVQLSPGQNFDLACSNLTPTTYTVTATGKGPMAGFTYTINEGNVHTSAFTGTGNSKGWTAANPNTCWVIRKGAVC